MKKLFMSRDLIVIAAVLVLCAGFYGVKHFSGSAAPVAYVTEGGELKEQISLNEVTEPRKIDLGGKYNVTLLVEPGSISFLSSDCHDKICIHSGKLSKNGDTAACLPAGVVVTVKNGEKEFDAISY